MEKSRRSSQTTRLLLRLREFRILCASSSFDLLYFRWPTPDAGGYIQLFQNLGAAIRAGAEPAVKWVDATAVIEIIELAHESSRKKATVPVPTL